MELKFDENKLQNIIQTVSPELLVKSQRRAISKSASRVLTAVIREIRSEYNIKLKDVKKRIKITKGVDSIRLDIKAEKIPLIEFATNKTSAISTTTPRVKIKKNGPSKKLPGMFYAVMQSGHMGIFVRARAKRRLKVNYGNNTYKRVNKNKHEELSITELVGIDLVNSVNKTKAKDKALETFAEVYQSEFIRQLEGKGFV